MPDKSNKKQENKINLLFRYRVTFCYFFEKNVNVTISVTYIGKLFEEINFIVIL